MPPAPARRPRIAFAGTPEFAARALDALATFDCDIPLVLTQPDRPAGRGMKLMPSPVKQRALAHGLTVAQPDTLKTPELRAPLVEAAPDLLVVVAYGLLLPRAVLDIPRLGCINIHASLLPRWRGAAPIHRAIEAGDARTGITLMQMDEGLDTGPMLAERTVDIAADDTTATLHDRLAVTGAQLLIDTLPALLAGRIRAVPQPADGACYAAKIGKAEAALDFRRPAVELARAIRAFNPFPGALMTVDGTPIKLWRARVEPASGEPGRILAVGDDGVVIACGEGALRVTELQKPGGKRLPAADFLHGHPLVVGQRAEG
ncbi:Methionyl-tRNA formyltransferase [Methyloversatilis universalis FAM5]|uniref:Methionyl-tRNA formyltransferase n=1 Tax=Methyloversatilis universalis (strain ATCC BAA-1314 / DSM 25237 / JCM 13912 / CCUG 52030 / FAM5) TaxID=1000565 RepID=F5RFI2_METUF|nr:methionyl-tRNA formyltransferase [Methyloversatilis universalis]EGK70838.1 Methionyl-tRNA formyltransferase [Methyloversatilis universalis FAM5]